MRFESLPICTREVKQDDISIEVTVQSGPSIQSARWEHTIEAMVILKHSRANIVTYKEEMVGSIADARLESSPFPDNGADALTKTITRNTGR